MLPKRIFISSKAARIELIMDGISYIITDVVINLSSLCIIDKSKKINNFRILPSLQHLNDWVQTAF